VAIQLSRAGLPIVLVGGEVTSLDTDLVTPDNMTGARSAATYLAQLGHRRIAIINSPPERTAGRVRREGFVAGLKAHGLSLLPGLELAGPYGREGGYTAMVRLLSLPKAKRPTAVFSSGSLVTIGALRAIRELGVKMPDELSLISFDDYELFDALTPPLTVVDQPMTEQGTVAMRLLLERLADPYAPARRVMLETPLILRGSCAPPTH
jgi:LacI family transcriptional regulator